MLALAFRFDRLFVTHGWLVGLLLVALTVGLGTHGFLATKWDNGSDLSLADARCTLRPHRSNFTSAIPGWMGSGNGPLPKSSQKGRV